MKLQLLGTGNAAQVPVYNCSCPACQRARTDVSYRRGPCSALFTCGEQHWLIDSGLPDLTERFPPGRLSGILQTHYHADHAQGLLHLRWGTNTRIRVLGPHDPDGFADLYRHPGILDFSHTLTPEETVSMGDFDIVPLALTHSKPTLGYLFSALGKRIAYLTDTVGLPAATMARLQEDGLDLVVLDCSFPPAATTPRNHNDVTCALDTLTALNARQSVLTHIGHELDCWLMEPGNTLPADVLVGYDGAQYET